METVITRFPPSPTGSLHIGGARTALFNWLFARHHGGKFVLRIEDTDVARSTEESTRGIFDGMEWLGLEWDEGPYYQTQRLDIYKEYLQKLLDMGHAYYCDCSPDELDARRKEAMAEGRKPKYDGRCRDRGLGPGPNRVIRFRCPDSGTTVLNDLIKGPIFFDNAELDDLVLQRSDGIPTYNFVVVIDDVTMNITHVIRGDDHVNNTPRQILIYQALGAPLPQFGHVPMILGQDKAKLSKRHGATSVMAYKAMGFLPEALVNGLVRLGWAHGDQEIFSREELIQYFSLENIGKSPSVFNLEKLLWLNAHYIKESEPHTLVPLLKPFLEKRGYPAKPDGYVGEAVRTLQTRVHTLEEMADGMKFFLVDDVEYDPAAAKKFLTPTMQEAFDRLIPVFESMEVFNEENLEKAFHQIVVTEMGLKLGKVAQPVRVALTGGTVSPGLFEIIGVLGKETVLKRLKRALEHMKSQ
ncbi:glutamate--tRNA ligase [Desulforhabdus sp. TSK]|uniref:glutamate--tRNA ligase n=1 Tax=Desulforhabdus sp. TSK TaxID=2925014 RepID=UPI001FC8C486|nr:glutamate--tRNA ligase [Desulforhabdus sp. TSK]GKT09046.1 glutamate--tRNA ligase [Desulforhabdus sp. TSK]